MTARQLQQLEDRYRSSFARMETARERRNAAVRSAVAAGWTFEQISAATGITRQRLHQITHRNQLAPARTPAPTAR